MGRIDVHHHIFPPQFLKEALAYAVLDGLGPQAAQDHGAAHGALAMTTPGDASRVDGADVEAAIGATGASVIG